MLEGKYKEKPKNTTDGTERTIRTADNRTLVQKLTSTPPNFQKSPKKDISPKTHQLRGRGGKYVSVQEKARKMEEGIVSQSKPKVKKTESDKENSDF